MNTNTLKRLALLVVLVIANLGLLAQIPNGYYNNATGKTGDDLKVALHDIIKDHTTITYQQIWSAFWSTDNKGDNVVWDMYSDGATYSYNYYNNDQCGTYEQEGDCFNREHSWPQSWFSNAATPTTDLHHIFPTDGFVNYQRSNFPFGEVSNATWTSQNGSKLGPCKSSLGYTGKVFEPIDEYKGDFARALMYMSVRYYGEDDDWSSSGMTNKSVIEDWAINMLLDWSDNDPVSQKEIDRNNVIYGIQRNRNPFIDHPEYAHIIWEAGWSGVTYNITCATVNHGSISAPSTAVEGTMVTLTATPAQGYMLGSWNVYKTGDANTTVPVSANGTFTMPSFNVTVSATFTQNSTAYHITCATGLAHGSINANAGSAQSGSTITLSNTPASGYVLYSYYVYKTGDVNTIVYSGTGSTFVMPAYDVTVSASFVQPSGYAYVKVTEAPTDWSGEYLLVYENNATTAYVWTGVEAASCYEEKTITNNTIAVGDMVSITVAPMTGGYSIKVNGGTNNGKYIYGTNGSNKINFGNTAALNTIAYESDGIAITSNTSVMRYNKASSDNRFRYYKSSTYASQQPVQLYEKSAAGASAPTHTIQFKPNGGSPSGYTQTVNEFEPTALQANSFTRDDYAFDRWNTAADGTGTTYFDGTVVTLLNDLTLYAQWKQLYTITLAEVENGTVTVSHDEAVEGDVVSLTATPNSGYEFDHWIVTDASNHPVAVTDNQFEMPAADVTVSAVFVYVGAPFVQQYYLVTSTDQLVAGRTYLIVNTDYKKALGKTQNSNNRSAATVTIDNNVIATLGDACELTLGGETGAWTLYDATNNSGYLYAAGGSGTNNYLRTQTTLTTAGKWTITISNSKATIKTIDSSVNRHTIMYNTNNIFSCYASGQKDVCLFIRSEEYDHVEDETIDHLFSFDNHTVRSGVTLTVEGTATCDDASHLTLEDGAQFVHHNNGVKATFKKSIDAYTTTGGWYTIATPFASYTPAGTMVEDDFDLYAYDEDADLEWVNYKSHANSFVMEAGMGYLYAHNPGTMLRMTGTLNNGDDTQTVALGYANSDANLKGFNLLGNPTAHDIRFTKTTNVSDGYYYLVNGENWAYTTSNIVPVGRGFMVKANAASQSVTLNPQSKDDSDEEGQYICLSMDEAKAYVKLNEGVSMPLLSMTGEQAPLYLTRDGKRFAMLVRDNASSLDLNFKARHNGQQTLSVDLQGNTLEYLHLIDNMTGVDVDLLALRPFDRLRTQGPAEYTFDANVGDYEYRFRLVFSSICEDADGDNGTFAYVNNGEIVMVETCHGASLQVVDMMGRVVVSGDAKHCVSTRGMAPGVYVLRLIDGDNVKTQKIVLN